jgi:hypothetical protein
MKRDNWKVDEYSIRPAGDPNKCFYCDTPRGGEHKADCVIRSRTVVVKMTAQYVVQVPEYWDADQIEFHRNEGSWCASNGIAELEQMEGRVGCLCGSIEYAYVREASAQDQLDNKLFVEDCQS